MGARRSTLSAQAPGQKNAFAWCVPFHSLALLCGSSRFGRIIRLDLVGRIYAARKLLAIREGDLDDAPHWRAALDRKRRESNLIPGLQGLIGPAHADHSGRIFRFRDPMPDVAALIGYVHLNHAMRIGPYKPRDGSLESDLFIRVVGRVAVMREQRNGNGQHENDREEKGRRLVSHSTPPYGCTGHHSVLHGRPRAGAM